MAAQDWNFAVLDDEYNQLNGGPWAGLNGFANAEDLEDVGAHWSSDTWNEPHPDAGQREPDHTSHAPPPLSSPPSQHVNDGPLRNNASVDLNRYHDTSRQLPHESLPANTNYQAPSRQAPTSNTWQPILSRDPLPQPSHSRESFVPTTAHQSTTEQGTRNQTLLQPYGYEIDHEAVVTDSDDDAVMPPRRRSAVNGSPVDLTQSPDMATASASQQSRTRKRSSASRGDEGSAKKRAKRTSMSTARVDAEDLEDEAPSADAELLQAQQREALKMQETKKDDEPVKIGQRTCIICLENYTNATTAICGHIFCHECLTRALMASEKNNDRGKGNCPACRKAINRRNAKEVIPISFLKKSAFKTKGRQAHNR